MGKWSKIISHLKGTARENNGKLTLGDLETVHQAFELEDDEMAELMDICEQMGIRVFDEDEPAHKLISLDRISVGAFDFDARQRHNESRLSRLRTLQRRYTRTQSRKLGCF